MVMTTMLVMLIHAVIRCSFKLTCLYLNPGVDCPEGSGDARESGEITMAVFSVTRL